MKTTFLLVFIVGLYAVASELEFRSIQDLQRARYQSCISTSSQFVITDWEISEMVALCEARTGYTSEDTP